MTDFFSLNIALHIEYARKSRKRPRGEKSEMNASCTVYG